MVRLEAEDVAPLERREDLPREVPEVRRDADAPPGAVGEDVADRLDAVVRRRRRRGRSGRHRRRRPRRRRETVRGRRRAAPGGPPSRASRASRRREGRASWRGRPPSRRGRSARASGGAPRRRRASSRACRAALRSAAARGRRRGGPPSGPARTTAQFPEEPDPRKATSITPSPSTRSRRRRAPVPFSSGAALEQRPHDRRHDELRDPLPARDRHRLGAEVHDDHPDLAAVVGVDRPDAVREGEPLLQREARPGPDLRLVAGRDLERQPRRDDGARAGSERRSARRRPRAGRRPPRGRSRTAGARGPRTPGGAGPDVHLRRHDALTPRARPRGRRRWRRRGTGPVTPKPEAGRALPKRAPMASSTSAAVTASISAITSSASPGPAPVEPAPATADSRRDEVDSSDIAISARTWSFARRSSARVIPACRSSPEDRRPWRGRASGASSAPWPPR